MKQLKQLEMVKCMNDFFIRIIESIEKSNELIRENTKMLEQVIHGYELKESIEPGFMQIEFDPSDRDSKYAVMGIMQDMIESEEAMHQAFEDEFDDEEE